MTRESNPSLELQSAAIVCEHVASGAKAIRIAERSTPEDDADSGWQFCCGDEDEDWTQAQVWSVQEVLLVEPSLSEFVNLLPEMMLTRVAFGARWEQVVD